MFILVREELRKKKLEKRKVLLLTGFRGVPSLVDPTVQCVPSFVTYIRGSFFSFSLACQMESSEHVFFVTISQSWFLSFPSKSCLVDINRAG